MAAPPPSQPPAPPAVAQKKKPSPSHPPIIPWTHEETGQLIEAYQEKWYSLRRGPLKSAQWEEVAVTVAARCGHDDGDSSARPSKSALQCRHKMEKLRQRFRSECHRLGPDGPSSAWPFFVPMDRMLRGPLPISARPMEEADDDDDDDQGGGHNGSSSTKSRSIDYILRRPAMVNRFPAREGNNSCVSEEPMPKRPRHGGEANAEVSERENVILKLAAEIRAFSERLVGMESLKMEVARETERSRMEMERKRNEMILRSQNRILDSIARVFGSPNRTHLSTVAKKET